MRISDWSSDVCSSDLAAINQRRDIGERGADRVDTGQHGRKVFSRAPRYASEIADARRTGRPARITTSAFPIAPPGTDAVHSTQTLASAMARRPRTPLSLRIRTGRGRGTGGGRVGQ